MPNYFAATAALDKLVIPNYNSPDGIITLRPYSVTQIKTSGYLIPPLQGDLNNDGIINIIIYLNGEYDSLADLNQDGVIDTIDVIHVVNLILDGN